MRASAGVGTERNRRIYTEGGGRKERVAARAVVAMGSPGWKIETESDGPESIREG